MIMLPLFMELTKYGVLIVQSDRGRWWVTSEVRIPGTKYKSYVRLSGRDFYGVLSTLIPLVKKEFDELLMEARAPKQAKFDYGTTGDYEEK
jgi:hypothetical protein